jgi:hypothetical protein
MIATFDSGGKQIKQLWSHGCDTGANYREKFFELYSVAGFLGVYICFNISSRHILHSLWHFFYFIVVWA